MKNGEPVNCLHISPHYGGGVGATVSSLINHLSSAFLIDNTVVSLDFLDNKEYVNSLPARVLVYENLFRHTAQLTRLIDSADVVLVHYWNHPLLAVFLSQYRFPPSKLVFWAHTSGLHEPNILPTYLYEVGNKVVYSSSISLSLPEVASPNFRSKVCVVRSARDISQFLAIPSSKSKFTSKMRALYIGTVSKQKMHPESAYIFKNIAARGITIDIIGEPSDQDLVRSLKDVSRVTFHGFHSDIRPFLSQADCFIYPLNSCHYGTGELALVEAMASGLPCICMDNPAERSIVDHCRNGFLADSPDEFIDYTVHLLNSPSLISNYSASAVEKANRNFSLESSTEKLASVLLEVNKQSENTFEGIPCVTKVSGDPVFTTMIMHSFVANKAKIMLSLTSLDEIEAFAVSAYKSAYGAVFSSAVNLPTKGSPAQYLRYFPDSLGVSHVCTGLASHD